MDRKDKSMIMVQIPIFLAGILFLGLSIRQNFFWLKLFDLAFGIFDMIFSTVITVSIVRDWIRRG